MSLHTYHHRRQCNSTPEPCGDGLASGRVLTFAVQKHAASRLHYDLRLEWGGVLKSWALPRGPSLDPSVRALAIEVEDHPLEYADFEGVIPENSYGAGAVLLWDRGSWTPLEDAAEGFRHGSLRFELGGRKLKGVWRLVRMRDQGNGHPHWLLIKSRDEFAQPGNGFRILTDAPRSVKSDRGIEELHPPLKLVRGRASVADGDVVASAADARRASMSVSAAHQTSASVQGVAISHPDRVVFPDTGITKLDLARYFDAVADWMVPHARSRPLMLLRHPGAAGEFLQKHPTTAPLRGQSVVGLRESSGTGTYLYVTDAAGLVGLAQMSAVEIHSMGSRVGRLACADRVIFDLDPGPRVAWPALIAAACDVRDSLAKLGLESFAKTSGGRGIHVLVPVAPRISWGQIKMFARAVSERLVPEHADRYVAKATKAARPGRVYIDYLLNARDATCAEVLSPRARPGAPVSIPVSWSTLATVRGPGEFTVTTAPALLQSGTDPWPAFFNVRQAVTPAMLRKISVM